jgi:predicted aspartyl protease
MAFHSYDVGSLGCLIQVGLKVGGFYANAGKGGSPGSWTGLIDTGASKTAISDAVVRSLSPQEVGRGQIDRTGANPKQVLIYEIQLKLDGYLSAGRWFTLEVVHTQPATPGIDVLIGMDLLKQFHFYLSGPDGKLVLSY